ncbi:class II myosin, partial [Oleoguttula sp. CCFEE 5521]
KYQTELATLTNELDIERESVIHARTENGRLRDELEDLRNKCDDEVLNSSTWAKEKSRLEVALQSLSDSRDEAVTAHNDAQSKVVDLLGQVRTLRTDIDDVVAERELLVKEKKGIESRLASAAASLEDLSLHGSPAKRSAALSDREVLDLKTKLAQQEDIASAAVGKMRRAELLAQEVQKDITAERQRGVDLHREKAALEKGVKELQLRCVDLETKGYSTGSGDVRFLNSRIQELESTLDSLESTRATESRSVRNVDRTVKDLQSQITRREKSSQLLSDDLSKSREKIDRLLSTIDELQASDSSAQLSAKRAERELREEKEARLRLERELESLRGLRVERGSVRGSDRLGISAGLSDYGGGSRRGSGVRPPGSANGEVKLAVPERKSSLSKGFL